MERETGEADEIPIGICHRCFLSVLCLIFLRITKAGSGQKGASSASRGQSLLENPFLNRPKPLLRIADSQVGRSLQEFYLRRETSSKFSFKREVNLKQVFSFEIEGLARVRVIRTFTHPFVCLWNLDKDFCLGALREWISQKGLACCTS